MRRILSALMMLCISAAVLTAQARECKGVVVDEEGEPIPGASVVVTNGKALGVTDIDGTFKVNAPNNAKTLTFSFVGYESSTVGVSDDMGSITLKPKAEVLNDVVVTQSLARTRQTPVALSQINQIDIDLKLGSQEFPEILKTTPGVWATKDGGGFGDAKVNMRGFKSDNLAIMVNGIPINDMEGGWVYWSNWAGLSDVASNIQTQRGLGAAVLSAPSVGGTINVTTASTDAKRGGSVWYGMGNDGLNQIGMKVSTGMMKNGWAITMMGSRRWGDGYIQGTWFNSYNYFLNVSKKFNESHQLSLTAFGAPQTHNKRSSQDGLTIMGYQTLARDYMDGESPYRYNPTWGYDRNGNPRTSNLNKYHKPQISLAHTWKINEKSSLSTTLYMSIASGGGYSGQGRTSNWRSAWYGANKGELTTDFRNPDGTFAYDKVQEMNAASATGSNMIMSESNNSHNWYGLISTYTNKFWDNKLSFLAGIDMRYYIGKHNNKIVDLYDGAYYIDDLNRGSVDPANSAIYNKNNTEWVNEKLGVGDIVYRNYDGRTNQEGAYVQGELSLLDRKLTLVLSGALSNTGYQRVDYFYYDKDNGKSKTYNFLGGTAKFGANYNIDRHNNVFFNVGYISRAPYFAKGVFLSQATSNAANPDPLNEKVFSAEIGYGFSSRMFSATLNGYYTKWLDKTTTRSGVIGQGPDRYYMNMGGVDARHMGIEFNCTFIPVKGIELTGMVSLGDYIWDSNAIGYYYNENGQPLANTTTGALASSIMADDHVRGTLMQKGRKVGGSAQTTAALGATFRPFKGFRIGCDWTVADRLYSDYEVSAPGAGGTVTVADPWRAPWGNQFDLHASYKFEVGGVEAVLSGNLQNLFNYNYVVDAYTSSSTNGTWENAYRVFYNFGRTYTMKLRVNF